MSNFKTRLGPVMLDNSTYKPIFFITKITERFLRLVVLINVFEYKYT